MVRCGVYPPWACPWGMPMGYTTPLPPLGVPHPASLLPCFPASQLPAGLERASGLKRTERASARSGPDKSGPELASGLKTARRAKAGSREQGSRKAGEAGSRKQGAGNWPYGLSSPYYWPYGPYYLITEPYGPYYLITEPYGLLLPYYWPYGLLLPYYWPNGRCYHVTGPTGLVGQ